MRRWLLCWSAAALLACGPSQPASSPENPIQVALVDVVRGDEGRAGLLLRVRNGLSQSVIVLHDLKRVALTEGETYSVVRRELGEGVEEPVELDGACDLRGQPTLKPGETVTIADFVSAAFQPGALFEVVIGVKFLNLQCSKLLVEAPTVTLSYRVPG